MMQFLIVAPSWLGDMVMAHSLIRSLKAMYPKAEIDVLAPKGSFDILAFFPEVRRAIKLPFAHGEFGLFKRIQLGRTLKKQGYNTAYVLPNSWKSAIVPMAAGIPLRVGFTGEQRYGLLNVRYRNSTAKGLPMVNRYMALLGQQDQTPLLVPKLAVTDIQAIASLERFDVSANKPILALCPGAAYGWAKQYPSQHWASLAAHYLSLGFEVLLLGSRGDEDIGNEIQLLVPECKNLVGQTDLHDAVCLLACATQIISNDSGLMHVAAALHRPTVSIFGPTDPIHTPPLSSRAKAVHLQLDCQPCGKRECPLSHHHCMKQLMPEQVISAVTELQRESAHH